MTPLWLSLIAWTKNQGQMDGNAIKIKNKIIRRTLTEAVPFMPRAFKEEAHFYLLTNY